MNKKAIVHVIILAVVVLGGYYVLSTSPFAGAVTPDISTYQAVFLNTNQVYFGKLASVSGQWLKLTDVYYLENNPAAQKPSARGQESTPKFVLKKLGKEEVHTPTDLMVINRDSVTLWENLKSDSPVITKIKEEKQTSK